LPLLAALHDLTGADAPDAPDCAPALAKRYPRMPRVALSAASAPVHADTGHDLSAEALGRLLISALGPDGIPPASPVPAAELIELYVAARGIIDVAPGLYHWDRTTTALEVLPLPEGHVQALWRTLEPDPPRAAAAVVVAGRAGVATSTAGPRGYRRMLLAAGAVVAAVLRAAQADGVLAQVVEPFDEELAENILGLGADEERRRRTPPLKLAVGAMASPIS
jgi:hypothetical protein